MPNPSLRQFTFFHTDGCERQTLEPIAEEAARRGYGVRFTEHMGEGADIGVYCQHACRPNANFSVITLHDLAQRHDIWPKFWQAEPWSEFDIGLVPGDTWVERWQSQADFPEARPRLGLFNLGWPKADLVFRNRGRFAEVAADLRQQLGLKYEHSVLYAPSWENDGKQDDFVKSLIDLPVNLLLKQAPWSDDYPMVLENIRVMNERHRGCAPHVHIMDRDISIMYCLGLADILVSDESSVLTEALLLDVPGVAVTDWMIPDCDPPRVAAVPYDYVTKTRKADLKHTVQAILEDPGRYRDSTAQARQRQFSRLGQSASAILDTIEAALDGSPFPYPPCVPQVDRDRQQFRIAEGLIRQGKTSQGLQQLFALAKADTVCWDVYNLLGLLSFEGGKLDQAVLCMEIAANRAPDPKPALSNLIDIQCARQDREKALAALAVYVQQTPSSPQLFSAIQAFIQVLNSAGPSPSLCMPQGASESGEAQRP